MIKTVDDIMAAGPTGPCKDYPRHRVESLVGEGIDEAQLLELNIPRKDILWALVNAWLTPQHKALWVCDYAERTLRKEKEAGRDPDKRSWDAVGVARRYIAGEATDDELRRARAAALAALAAARDAVWAAGWGAAWTVWAAARDAVWAAGWAVALATGDTSDAELEWQIQRAFGYIKENEKETTNE